MSKNKKYHEGAVITSLDELVRQKFVYCNGKLLHCGWFASWQLRLAAMYIRRGALTYALEFDIDNGGNKNENSEKDVS